MADIPEGVPPVSAPSPTLPAEDASATQIQRVFRGGRARRRTMESSLDVTAPTAAPTEEAAQELSGAFETLRGMPVLGSLATASLHQVAAAVTSVEFEDGAELVARGDHNALLFCVTAGTVEKRQDDLVVGIVSAGDIFGATALMSRMHRTTSVRAVGAVGCLRLARADVDRCLDQASVDDLEIHLKRFIAAKSDLYGQRHTKRIAFIQGTLEEEHQTSPTKTAKRYRAVAKGVIRKEFDMSSPKVGDVLAGEEIDALESRELDTPAGKTWRIMFEKGWCNVSSQKGVPLLEEITSESANDVVQRTMMEALSYGGGDDDEADATAAEGADAELGATAEGGSPGGGGRPRQRSWMPKGRHARTRSEVEQQVEDQLKVTFLDTVPLLQPLTRRELTQLAGVVTTEEYEAEPIIEYGVRGDSMFILREGEAQAERHGVVLKTYSAGDFFGELALLSGGRRAATVRAIGPVRCMRLGREPFQEVVHHNKLVRDMCDTARRNYAAMVIQCAYRGWVARQALIIEMMEEDPAESAFSPRTSTGAGSPLSSPRVGSEGGGGAADEPQPEEEEEAPAVTPMEGGGAEQPLFLRGVPLFKALTDEELVEIGEVMAEDYYEDEPIVEKGDDGDSMFVLREGTAVVRSDEGEVLKTYERGDYFGELALLTQGGQRAVTVEAVGPVHCLRLGRGPFDGLIAKNQHVKTTMEKQRRQYRWSGGARKR